MVPPEGWWALKNRILILLIITGLGVQVGQRAWGEAKPPALPPPLPSLAAPGEALAEPWLRCP